MSSLKLLKHVLKHAILSPDPVVTSSNESLPPQNTTQQRTLQELRNSTVRDGPLLFSTGCSSFMWNNSKSLTDAIFTANHIHKIFSMIRPPSNVTPNCKSPPRLPSAYLSVIVALFTCTCAYIHVLQSRGRSGPTKVSRFSGIVMARIISSSNVIYYAILILGSLFGFSAVLNISCCSLSGRTLD